MNWFEVLSEGFGIKLSDTPIRVAARLIESFLASLMILSTLASLVMTLESDLLFLFFVFFIFSS